MSRFVFVAGGAALAAVLSLAPAGAENPSVTVSASAPTPSGFYSVQAVKVPYGDIDLTTEQGAAALLERLNLAARLACNEERGVAQWPNLAKAFAHCHATAVMYAVKAVDAPLLSKRAAQ